MKGAPVSFVAAILAALTALAADRAYTITDGYTFDSTTRPILTLVRGRSYLFNAASVSTIHPFKLTTSSTGGSSPNYTNNVTGAQPICSGGSFCFGTSFVFAPDSNTPDTLYYQCNIHQNLGNQIRVVNPPQMSSLMFTGGLIGITFTNAYGTTATVQRATDLFSNTWVTIQTITAAPGVVSLVVTNLPPMQHLRATTPLP